MPDFKGVIMLTQKQRNTICIDDLHERAGAMLDRLGDSADERAEYVRFYLVSLCGLLNTLRGDVCDISETLNAIDEELIDISGIKRTMPEQLHRSACKAYVQTGVLGETRQRAELKIVGVV